jgi:hypothetical protein
MLLGKEVLNQMTLLSRGVILLALLVASVSSAQGQSKWVVYAPKKLGFRIELPMQPTVRSTDAKTTYGPARSTYLFFKGENGLQGRMEVTDYQPGKISKDPRAYLDESREHYERSGALRSESRFSLDGAPAQRFVMDTVDGRVATVQEVVIDDRLISVICFAPKGTDSSADVGRIYKSFALTKS